MDGTAYADLNIVGLVNPTAPLFFGVRMWREVWDDPYCRVMLRVGLFTVAHTVVLIVGCM